MDSWLDIGEDGTGVARVKSILNYLTSVFRDGITGENEKVGGFVFRRAGFATHESCLRGVNFPYDKEGGRDLKTISK